MQDVTLKKIAIIACKHCWAGSIYLTEDFLCASNYFGDKDAQKIETQIVGIEQAPLPSFSGSLMTPMASISSDQQFDAIILPTLWQVNDEMLESFAPLYPWLRRQYVNGAHIFGVLTGAYLVAEAGLLDGKEATAHWTATEDFQKRYPQVKLRNDKMITSQDRILCGSGINAVTDICVHMIELFRGKNTAEIAAKHFLMGSRRTYRKSHISFDCFKEHSDEKIMSIQTWFEDNFSSPINIEETARRFGMSTRTLTRRFKSATGEAPGQYLQRLNQRINGRH